MIILKRLLVLLSLTDTTAHAAGYLDQMNFSLGIGLQRQSSALSSPPTGWLNCYALISDGKVYCKNSSGTAQAFAYSGAIVNADLSGSAGITNANLATMPNGDIKCRKTSGTGTPEDCSASDIFTILGTIPAASLPTPGASTLGGVLSDPCLAHNFVTSITTAGDQTCAQPAFTDFTGRATSSQVPTDVAYTDVANVFSQPQSIGGNALTITVTNDGSTGTANNKLAKFNGNAVKTGTSDTEGAIGVVVSGGGTTSSAQIAVAGIATCTSDNSTTAGDYAQISSSVAGDCTDTGSTTYPTSGQVVGIWRESGSAGQRTLFVLPGESLSHLSASNLTTGTTPVARGGTSLGTLTVHAVQVGNGTSAVTQVGPSSSTAFPLVSGGSSADPAYALLGVAGGGTGLATLTAHAVYVGNGTSAPTVLSVGANNTVLRGSTGADPAFGSLVGADLPNPSASTLGGVESLAAVSHNFLTSISTSGVPAQAQPAFTDISGTATVAQVTPPNVALTTCTTARTVDWSTGINFTLTLTNGNACALTWSNASSAQTICIDLYQASSGGGTATVTFATTTLKSATFTMTTGNSATDTICVKYNGTDYRLVPQQVFQ